MIIFNFLQSVAILSDSCHNFTDFLLMGLEVNRKKINSYVEQSLMLVTALAPKIGYDNAAQVAHIALEKDLTLKEVCLELGYISSEEFDAIVDPYKMAYPNL